MRLGGKSLLYVSGEESETQIKMRGERLGLYPEHLFLLTETCLERIMDLNHVYLVAPVAQVVQTPTVSMRIKQVADHDGKTPSLVPMHESGRNPRQICVAALRR